MSRDVDEELSYHHERTVDELEASGLSRGEAESEARRRFGDERRWRRELERQGRWSASRSSLVDRLRVATAVVHSAVRGVGRSPALSSCIVLMFALGVGANAVMFGVVDRLLLRSPAHVSAPDQVRRVLVERAMIGPASMRGMGSTPERRAWETLAYPDYADLRGAEAFTSVAAYSARKLVLGRGREAREVRGILATGSYFGLLGTRPAAGRFFGEAEDRIGGDRVAVISHGLWQRRFGGDPAAIGELLDLDLPGGPFEVIGVAPRGFTGVDIRGADVWLPLLAAHPAAEVFHNSRGWFFLRAVARLSPAATVEGAAARATALHRQARGEEMEAGGYDADTSVLLTSLIAARGPLASDESVVAKWLAGVSLVVLLIACANVANLLLARTTRRRREVAVRLALGVSRSRLGAEMLAEGLLLALLGSVAALAIARWGAALVQGALLPNVAWSEGLDPRVVAFTAALAVVAGVAAFLLPMAQATRERVSAALRSDGGGSAGGGGGSAGGGGRRLRNGLSALQAALSVVLLIGAGLFVRSLDRIGSVDLGFDAAGVLMVEPVGEDITQEARGALMAAAKARVVALGRVESATLIAGSSPLYSEDVTRIRLPGTDSLPAMPGGLPAIHAVDDDYLRTMSLRIVAGRWIESGDVRGAAPVVVVNTAMAGQLWPDGDALGECLIIGNADGCATVVGIVETAIINRIPEEPRAQYYVALAQELVDWPPQAMFVRLAGPGPGTTSAVRTAVTDVDSRVRYASVMPLEELLAPYTRSWALGATLFTAFGLLALLVAGIGLYSVLAYDVTRRTPEIGIRAALGASRDRIVRGVVARAMGVAAAGIGAGLVFALALGPQVSDLLYETSPTDPATLAVVALVLLAVALAAAAGPALRASRVDPSEALRAE